MVTPPLFAPDNRAKDAINYDGVMEAYGAWLVAQRSAGWQVIDIHPLLHQSVAAAKKAELTTEWASFATLPAMAGQVTAKLTELGFTKADLKGLSPRVLSLTRADLIQLATKPTTLPPMRPKAVISRFFLRPETCR